MRWIDAHTHLWTPDTDHYPLAAGFTKQDMQPPSFTPEEFFSHAKPNGVNRAVVIQMSFYGTDNSYMLDSMQRLPDAFRGIGVIDVEATEPEKEMLRLSKAKVRGFRIRPKAGVEIERWLERPGYERMFAAGAEQNLAMCPLLDPSGLVAVSRMCRRFPKTPVIIDHLARIGAGRPISTVDQDALCALAVHARVMVKVSAFYALGNKKPPHDDLIPLIRKVFEAFGARRLMWASDCPYQVDNEKYSDSIGLIRRLDFLTPDDQEWILRRTAEQFFFA